MLSKWIANERQVFGKPNRLHNAICQLMIAHIAALASFVKDSELVVFALAQKIIRHGKSMLQLIEAGVWSD
jgi:hypothetical protein